MRTLIFLLASNLLVNSLGWAQPPSNFSQAKRIASSIFSTNRVTLYCQCPYDNYKRIDLKSCNMKEAKTKRRANRLEWEHMMPVANYIKHFECGREKLCVKKNGKRFGGRKCCEKIDKRFKQTEAELYNLWPAVGLVNGIRSNMNYAAIGNKKGIFGCNFKVDKQRRKVEPPNHAKGIVARASLFMSQKYHIRLSKQQRSLFNAWDKAYPPSSQELEWAKQVAQIEGYSNPYIDRHISG